MTPGDVTRCLIADDQAMVREGFRALLDAQPGLTVVGLAANGTEAVSLARKLKPDVVLMDVRMPVMDGLERGGASGFLLKDAPSQDLVHAVQVVARGDALLAPSITKRLIAEFAARRERPPGKPQTLDELTAREVEVLRLIARGMSNAEISKTLFIAEQTTKTHVGRILMKLQLRDRAQAVVFAYESGLISPRQ
jgi:DNA-binding NarL/FixJ family response regulator